MRKIKPLLFLAPGLLLAQSVVVPQPVTAALKLEPDKTLERTLSVGATDVFTLDLRKDQIVSLVLKDHGKDVILSVHGPGGDMRRAFRRSFRRAGRVRSSPSKAATGTLLG